MFTMVFRDIHGYSYKEMAPKSDQEARKPITKSNSKIQSQGSRTPQSQQQESG